MVYSKLGSNSWYSVFKDSDESRSTQWGESFKFEAAQNHSFQYDYVRAAFDDPLISRIYENRQGVGWMYSQNGRAFKLGYQYRDFAHHNDSHSYSWEASSPLWQGGYGTFGHGYNFFETAKAIDRKIKGFRNHLSISQQLSARWSASSHFGQTFYRDENIRNLVRSGILCQLWDVPVVKVGYEFSFHDTSFSSPFYWTPHNQRSHQARLGFSGNLFEKRFLYDIFYAFGTAKADGEEQSFSNSGQATLKFNLNEKTVVFINFERSDETTYRSQTIELGLRFNF